MSLEDIYIKCYNFNIDMLHYTHIHDLELFPEGKTVYFIHFYNSGLKK